MKSSQDEDYYQRKEKSMDMTKRFAVIDTETNWNNELMSVGVVIAEEGTFEAKEAKYVIISEAASIGGMYSGVLYLPDQNPEEICYSRTMKLLDDFLKIKDVQDVFAYNAAFDARLLSGLKDYIWHDILKLAAYRQFNPMIPKKAVCCKSGRLKSGYRVEDILQMFGEYGYHEKHNALTDAIDELRIMKYLDHPIDTYPAL